MKIYCTGCSHTEGCGLSDHIIFPDDCPKGTVQKNKSEAIKWTNIRSSLINRDPFLFERIRQENLKRAWPAKLASITGHDVINAAYGGAGIASMYMTMLYDLDALAKENKTPDLIIASLPGLERVLLVNRYPVPGYHPLAFKNVLPSFINNVHSNYKSYCESFFASHSHEEMLTFYLSHCLAIKHLSRDITGKDPIFVQIFDLLRWKNIVKDSNIFLLKKYWELLEFDKLLEEKTMESFNNEDKIMVADGHFKEEVHERFANYIAKDLLND